MLTLKDKVYKPDCSHNDIDIDSYYKRDEVFGHFAEDGRAYVIERRDTPRGWTQYLCNDKVRTSVTNIGKGNLFHASGVVVSKHHEVNGNYLPRNLNGERKILIQTDGGEVIDFFNDSENYTCTVRPGYVVFSGDIENLHIDVCIFVPLKATCECWNVKITNNSNSKKQIKTFAKQDIFKKSPIEDDLENAEIRSDIIDTYIKKNALSIFKADKANNLTYDTYVETYMDDSSVEYYSETIEADHVVSPNATIHWNIVSAACNNDAEIEEIRKFTNTDVCDTELKAIVKNWDEIIARNYCNIPDKNLERFLNIWLKNQLYLTYRYDRALSLTGYRDGMQDSWGHLLVDPYIIKEKLLFLFKYMYADGRCPRGVHKYGERHDLDDFCDAPIWIPIAINSYIKETGDYSILDEKVCYFKSEEIGTVEEHIYRSLDYMYHSRGKNGLILMRDGDWADGLTGINKYGADATSAWVTIAAYHAQNQMSEIYRRIGANDKADEMDRRSAEYKQIVNDVAWDGNWLVYAFFEDGEAIGSAKNLEGKIWLNPQTWGIFSGIIDDKSKIKKMSTAVSRYLDTPYGALVNYPAYVFYGDRCGRLARQRPGMFLNASVYNHAASFKVFSDIKRGEYDIAYDTFMRCLPNHPDNSDTRRTSEPFSVGNVYYGPEHPREGMNLFSYFTAAPAWLIHGGFDEMLGVKADFDGLRIDPHVPEDWNEYSVTKIYRGTKFEVTFTRSSDKGIFVDGMKTDGNLVTSQNPACKVEVRF
jgi:cellobiose phosphorylase